jgi:filamentous hemagglutinin family protein
MKTKTAFFFTLPLCLFTVSAVAQEAPIAPDGTLPTEVNTSGNVTEITGGAQAGGNLFHSFSNFSVPTGGEAFFNNAADINNIISRVTGGKVSSIDGLIRAKGSANLFLINPAGIVFGPNASLNIGGSFLGSTADSLAFPEGEFSATNIQKPLLTINAPIGLNFRDNPQPIENNSKADAGLDPAGASGYFGLRVPDGKSLALVGGDIKANGGGIITFGGRIDLAAVAGTGTVGLNINDSNLNLSVPDNISRADVSLTNGTGFLVAGNGGGDIAITGKNIRIDNSIFNAGILSNLGSEDAQAGDIKLNASEALTIANNSEIRNNIFSEASGNAGNINIQTKTLNVNNSQVGSAILDRGKGTSGDLTVKASDSINLNGEIPGEDGLNGPTGFPGGLLAQADFGAEGQSGNINIETNRLNISNGSKVQAATFGDGNAGNLTIRASEINVFNTSDANNFFATAINTGVSVDPRNVNPPKGNGGNLTIETDRLSIRNGGEVTADTDGEGNAGNVKINANDTISVDGLTDKDGSSRITSQVGFRDSTAKGNAGGVDITTKNLSVTNGGFISSSTFGEGDAGNIKINASDAISIDGSKNASFTGIASLVSETATGNAGGIDINTGSLSLTNGARVNANTLGAGNAGDLSVKATNLVDIKDEGSAITTTVASGAKGKGGNLTIETGSLKVSKGADILTDTFGDGDAGNLQIKTIDSVEVSGDGTFISADVNQDATGKAGNLAIDTGNLIVRDGGIVSASTYGKGDAGGVDITTKNLSVTNGGIISADTYKEGNAGDLTINVENFTVKNSNVSAFTNGIGNGGNLTVNASDSVELSGEFRDQNGKSIGPGGLFTDVNREGQGNAGNLTINTKRLSVSDGSKIQASTFGEGNAGDLTIRASDVDVFETPSYNVYSTGIFAEVSQAINPDSPEIIRAKGKGNAGNLTIETERLKIRDGGQVSTSTYGEGNAGILTVKASDSIEVSGKIQNDNELISSKGESFLAAEVKPNATGRGGNLKIETGELKIANEARLSVSSLDESGTAGNLDIKADSIQLDRGTITAATSLGEGGNIKLNIDDRLTMRNNSSISAQASNNANGGNITIDAPNGFIVAFPNQNNDIIATAQARKGGEINVNAQSIYGFDKKNIQSITDTQNLFNNGKNDINSTSGQPDLSGNININIQTLDPVKRTAQSSQNVVEPDTTVAQACDAEGTGGVSNSFTITGRGGMPADPTKPLNSSILAGVSKAEEQRGEGAEEQRSGGVQEQGGQVEAFDSDGKKKIFSFDEIIPARGVAINEKGQVVLTRYPTPNASDRPLSSSNYCSASTSEKLLATNIENEQTEEKLDDRTVEDLMNFLYSLNSDKKKT